jgi:lipid II:glycine glycyltransferase (peptidoglycan interpeptide bridge formation enzyme)
MATRLAERRESVATDAAIARQLGDRCRVGIAWIRNEAVASLILLWNGAHAHYWHSASDRELAGRTYAGYLLLARALEDAAGFGCEYVHMGESGGVRSLMEFKEHFGAERRHYPELRFEHPIVALAAELRRNVTTRLDRPTRQRNAAH